MVPVQIKQLLVTMLKILQTFKGHSGPGSDKRYYLRIITREVRRVRTGHTGSQTQNTRLQLGWYTVWVEIFFLFHLGTACENKKSYLNQEPVRAETTHQYRKNILQIWKKHIKLW